MVKTPLLLMVFGLSVGFLCVEALLRLTDPQIEIFNPLNGFHDGDVLLGWRGKPNIVRRFHRQDFDVVVQHGPEGFRRPDPAPPEQPAARVLFLGDSFTWGWGVPQGQVFTDHLQRASGNRVSVENRGVNAFGTAQEYLLLQETLRQRPYAKVAVMFFNNDVVENIAPKEHRPHIALVDGRLVPENLPLPPRLQNPIDTFLDNHSRALLFFSYQFSLLQSRIRERFQGEQTKSASKDDMDYKTLPGYPITARLLVEMKTISEQHGAQFGVVYVPSQSEMSSQPADDPYVRAVHQMLTDICERAHIPLVDLVPRFYDETRRGAQLTFAHDGHWNPTGHQLAAEIILDSPLFDGLRAETPTEPVKSQH
jgi:lysophospholipase L1-like esterase